MGFIKRILGKPICVCGHARRKHPERGNGTSPCMVCDCAGFNGK